ncbi:MAG: glycosyltransferase family 2 protein, partial [Thermodesulfobacteriota bacterium]
VDGTQEEIRKIVASDPKFSALDFTFLHNRKRIVPCGLNIGINEAKGEYIIRMDAHTEYTSNYILKCTEWLEKTGVENVGGPMRAIGNGYIGKAIELAHHSKFGLGGGKFHDDNYSGYVDTVYLGAWPKRVFEEVGLFDERLVRNQDIEFNARIRKAGGKIFLTPEIKSYYHCRNTLQGLWRQNYENGKWVVYTKAIVPYCLSWRHFIPLLFVVSLLLSGVISVICYLFEFNKLSTFYFLLSTITISGSYLFANLFFSVLLSIKNGLKHFFILPIVFGTLHLSYGLGSAWGLLTLKKWTKENRISRVETFH